MSLTRLKRTLSAALRGRHENDWTNCVGVTAAAAVALEPGSSAAVWKDVAAESIESLAPLRCSSRLTRLKTVQRNTRRRESWAAMYRLGRGA